MWMMLGFVLVDTIVGIYTAIKLKGQKAYKSHNLFNIVIKLFFYWATIMMAHAVSVIIFGGSTLGIAFLLPKVITMLWCYIEIKSLDESSMKLGHRSFWVIIRDFFTKVKTIKKDLNDLIDTDEK
jgi:Bacteriophage holin family